MADLEPPLLTNTNVFYAPGITFTLRPGLVTNSSVFYAPTLTQAAPAKLSGAKVREVDRMRRLAAAIKGTPSMHSRRARAPEVLTERFRRDRLTRRGERDTTKVTQIFAAVDARLDAAPQGAADALAYVPPYGATLPSYALPGLSGLANLSAGII